MFGNANNLYVVHTYTSKVCKYLFCTSRCLKRFFQALMKTGTTPARDPASLSIVSNLQGTKTSMQDSNYDPSYLRVGARFDSKDVAIMQLNSYAVKHRFEFHVVYSDKKRYRIKCRVDGCRWFVHVSPIAKGSSSFAVKTIGPDHVCGTLPALGNAAAGASWVSQ